MKYSFQMGGFEGFNQNGTALDLFNLCLLAPKTLDKLRYAIDLKTNKLVYIDVHDILIWEIPGSVENDLKAELEKWSTLKLLRKGVVVHENPLRISFELEFEGSVFVEMGSKLSFSEPDTLRDIVAHLSMFKFNGGTPIRLWDGDHDQGAKIAFLIDELVSYLDKLEMGINAVDDALKIYRAGVLL